MSTDTDPTTLSEFLDDSTTDSAASDDSPTPSENAEKIDYVIDSLERLTDRVIDLAEELEQRKQTDSIDTEPDTPKRMFQ